MSAAEQAATDVVRRARYTDEFDPDVAQGILALVARCEHAERLIHEVGLMLDQAETVTEYKRVLVHLDGRAAPETAPSPDKETAA